MLERGERRERLAGWLYGLVAVAAVLSVSSEDADPSVIAAAEYALATVLVFWIAHGWADALAARATAHKARRNWHVRRSFRRHAGIVLGALPPIAVMFAVKLAGATDATAETVGVYTAVGLLGIWGGTVAWREEAGVPGIVISAVLTALLGSLVGVLKALAH